jgi:uncharacterized membrane protein
MRNSCAEQPPRLANGGQPGFLAVARPEPASRSVKLEGEPEVGAPLDGIKAFRLLSPRRNAQWSGDRCGESEDRGRLMSPRRGRSHPDEPSEGTDRRGLVTARHAVRSPLTTRLRAYFLTGIIVTAPIGITMFLVWEFISFLDTRVVALLPTPYNPETYLPFSVPGLGLLIMLAFLTFVGMLAAGLAGRTLVRMGEHLLSRMPVIRSVYGTLKQIFETVLAQSSRSFREVVLVEYPRRGVGAIGFVTGPTRGEIQDMSDEELMNVFLPTTPNPTSGFLLFVPKKDLIHLDMSIEEGIKMVISGGIVVPPPDGTDAGGRGAVPGKEPEAERPPVTFEAPPTRTAAE